MPVVIVDGKEVEIGAQERLNGIEIARRIGADIPHYCWHPGLSVVASCRMCLVEAGQKDAATGKITMQPRLVPACQTPAKDGTVFVTNSKKVVDARAMVEEDLLLRHPVDCPICDKAGECSLQDYHFEHGRDARRADIAPFSSRRRELGDTVTLFVDRCVMCTRCVRFTHEISGTHELMVINRGAHEEIDVFRNDAGELQFPLDNKMSGNVCDLCPVGALGDKDFLYKQRVWFMKSHDNVCAGCSTGCSIKVEENQDHVYRLKPRENPHINQWWMCDEGRYGWKHVHDADRLTELRRKAPASNNGDYTNLEWHLLPVELDKSLKAAGKLGVALSPHLTVEEAYLLATYIRSIDAQAVVAMGPIPIEGTDEKFKNGFTIHAEKCPNRRGVEAVAAHFAGKVIGWDEFLKDHAGSLGGAWISGGYVKSPYDAAAAEKLADVKTLVVQDCFASPLWDAATYQLPGGTFAEREGSYVNYQDRLQSFRWAVRSPAGVKVEGQLFWQLTGRAGLYQAKQVLADVSRQIVFFSAAIKDVPEHGVDLKVNQLAAAQPPALSPHQERRPSMTLELLLEPLIKIAIILGGLMTAAAYFVLLERRMAAWIQDRIGPNRVGIPGTKIRLFGLGQPLADGIKFILKEEYTPAHVNKALYAIAPIVILAAALTTFVVIPMGSLIPSFQIGPVNREQPVEMIAAPGIDVGMILIFALSSIAVYGVILGGWSSNNKYSFLGGLRSSAQLIAYELPLSLGILGVVLAAGSLDLDAITKAQATQGWYFFLQPLGFVVFLIAAFAEASRLPFDLPEAEQELIGGYHTEYAGMKLLLFLVAEFLHMIAASFLIVQLFLGGWHLPYLTGDPDAQTISWVTAALRVGVLQAKIFAVIVFFMMVRWSWPRFRFDQLMALAWKIMLPLGILNLVAVAVVEELRHGKSSGDLTWKLIAIAIGWAVLIGGWLIVALTNPVVTDNRPRRDLATAEIDAQI